MLANSNKRKGKTAVSHSKSWKIPKLKKIFINKKISGEDFRKAVGILKKEVQNESNI